MHYKRKEMLAVALALILVACSTSKLDRAIIAVDAAVSLLPTLGLPKDEQPCANELFTGVSNALHDLKANPSAEQWRVVTDSVGRFDSAQCIHNSRLIAIVGAIQAIVRGVPNPKPTLTGRASPPDFNKSVKEEDLKTLEDLVKK